MNIVILALVAVAVLTGQTMIDLKTQSKRVDFSAAQSTKPVRMGTALPPTCSVGEMYLDVRGGAGSSLYVCDGTNVWVSQGGSLPIGPGGSVLVNSGNGAYEWGYLSGDVSGGSASTVTGLQGRHLSITAPDDGDALAWNATSSEWVPAKGTAGVAVQVDGVATGSRSTQDYITGVGVVMSALDTGASIQMQQAIDSAVVQTRTNDQSGADLMVTVNSSSGATFAGDMIPVLTQYTDGMVVQFRPNTSCTGTPMLDVDRLGARGLYEADGVTPMTCDAGNQYAMWYDAGRSLWRKYAALPAQAGNSGKYLTTDGGTPSWTTLSSISTLGITIDGGGSVIAPGTKGYVVVPFGCTIHNWSIVADRVGSIVVDVLKAASAVPVASIAASTRPSLTNAQIAVAEPATEWSTAVAEGDVLGFDVLSAANITRVTLTIGCKR